jgi:hypothetical protein
MICVLGCGKKGKRPVQVTEHAVVPCASCRPTGTVPAPRLFSLFQSVPKFVEHDVAPALRNILDPGMASSVADPGRTSWIRNTDGVRSASPDPM